MKSKAFSKFIVLLFLLLTGLLSSCVQAQKPEENKTLDEKVKKFLDSHENQWHDWNVPVSDGKLLYDIIIKNNYKSALEIGTSTGHSTIWIAWALSKTDGKLITIEINEGRYQEALENFKEAGLSDYIDARRADAHKLVKELKGPFDFVFCDADKHWYKNYFSEVAPKITAGGCYTAHNVQKYHRSHTSGRGRGISEFINYVDNLPDFKTSINETGSGLSISYKKTD